MDRFYLNLVGTSSMTCARTDNIFSFVGQRSRSPEVKLSSKNHFWGFISSFGLFWFHGWTQIV